MTSPLPNRLSNLHNSWERFPHTGQRSVSNYGYKLISQPATSGAPACRSWRASPPTRWTGTRSTCARSPTCGRPTRWSSTSTTASPLPRPREAAPSRRRMGCACRCGGSRSPPEPSPRYFTDQGVTTYCHVSDQHSTFGTQVIVSTERDGLYVLDEILGNTTELPIFEHTTDTHGQMLATFALFDFVGKKLSPRIAKITDKPLWRPHPASHYARWPLAGPLLSQHVQIDLIAEHWDDLRRIAGSLMLGYVSASLLVTRLQAGSRQHPLAKALLEYGKLMRTLHALRWFTDEAFRRRIGRQLNLGESLNNLRRFIAYADAGKEKHRHHEDQSMQAHCLTLVVNICVLSTTWYIQDAIEAEEAMGKRIAGEAKVHTSPAHPSAINPYGSLAGL